MPLGMNSGSSECVLRATSDQPSTRVCSERVGGRFRRVGETHRSSVLPGLCVGGLHPPYNRQTRLSEQTLMDRGRGEVPLKTLSLDSPEFTLEGRLREAAEGDVVFLTTDGLPRFALVAVDEGDQEIIALRSNADFMAYLDECQLRARRGPTKSLEEIQKKYLTEESVPGPTPKSLFHKPGLTVVGWVKPTTGRPWRA